MIAWKAYPTIRCYRNVNTVPDSRARCAQVKRLGPAARPVRRQVDMSLREGLSTNLISFRSAPAEKRLLLRPQRDNSLAMTTRHPALWLTVIARSVATQQSP